MFQTRWFVILITTLVTSCAQQLTGSIGNQSRYKALLLHDIASCVSQVNPLSLTQRYRDMIRCVQKQLSHCISKRPLPYSTSLTFVTRERNLYCGSIWTKAEKSGMTFVGNISITVTDNHYLHLSFLHFNFSLLRHMNCSHHALVLVSWPNEYYCGIRIPWTLILRENNVILSLSIQKYMAYNFKLVYISFSPNWGSKMAMLRKRYFASNQIAVINLPIDILDVEITNYQYYMMTSWGRILRIQTSNNDISNTILKIYDGPGTRSKNIFDSNKAITSNNLNIYSTSFSAFLTMESTGLRVNTLTTFYFRVSGVKFNSDKACYDFHKPTKNTMRQILRSSNQRNVYCTFNYSSPSIRHGQHLTLHVFRFSGSNMMTNLSPYQCQYGGLQIYISQLTEIRFCENLNRAFSFYAAVSWVAYTFASFVGYSQAGLVIDIFLTSDCSYYYADDLTSRKWDTEVKMTLQKATGCSIYICQPPLPDRETRCVIELGPSLGPTHITVGRIDNFKLCDNNIELDMKYVASENWPFNAGDNLAFRRYSISKSLKMDFFYLYNSTLIFSQTHCWDDLYSLRIFVKIRISSCEFEPDPRRNGIFLAHNIYRINHCKNTVYFLRKNMLTYFSNSGSKTLYFDLIYDSNSGKEGQFIHVGYKRCVMECRQYKYHTYFLDADGKTVTRYTTDVGNNVLMHKPHKGYRITVFLSSNTKHCYEADFKMFFYVDVFDVPERPNFSFSKRR